jgi:hypothetical protein
MSEYSAEGGHRVKLRQPFRPIRTDSSAPMDDARTAAPPEFSPSANGAAAPAVSLGRASVLLGSALACFILALVSAANDYTVGTLFWFGIAFAQLLTATRSPAFSYTRLGAYLRNTLGANRQRIRRYALIGGSVVFPVATFYGAWGNRFSLPLLVCWAGTIICWGAWLFEGELRLPAAPRLALTRENLSVLALLVLGGFALFYRLDDLPREMISDHVEYALDGVRVQEGARDIYFENNSGREPLFIYLITLVSGSGSISYLSLKLVSASAAWLMLPALYLLGRQANGHLTGLFTLGIGAFSTWTLVMGRLGFRVMFAALAVAWLLVALIHAARTRRRNDFLLAGAALGVGLYGYSSFRIAPLVVLVWAAFGWWRARGERRRWFFNTAALFILTLAIFLPLLAYWAHFPDRYWGRTNDLVGAVQTGFFNGFVRDFGATLLLFNRGGDPVSMNTVYPGAPVLTPLVGGLFLLGVALCLWRARRQWLARFILLAFLLTVLPSALATGRPEETPSARRAITALPVVMLLAGTGLAAVVRRVPGKPAAAYGVGAAALLLIGVTEFAVYARGYPQSYNPPPQREIAGAIQQFEANGGQLSDVYLVYGIQGGWLDPRAIALWLGEPHWNNVVYLVDTTACFAGSGRPLMVIMDSEDADSLYRLGKCFPRGEVTFNVINGSTSYQIYYLRNGGG